MEAYSNLIPDGVSPLPLFALAVAVIVIIWLPRHNVTALRSQLIDGPVWFVGRFPTAEDRMKVLAGPVPAKAEGRPQR